MCLRLNRYCVACSRGEPDIIRDFGVGVGCAMIELLETVIAGWRCILNEFL